MKTNYEKLMKINYEKLLIFYLPFTDQKFKADIIGPNTQSGRFPAMSAVSHAPSPVKCWRSHP